MHDLAQECHEAARILAKADPDVEVPSWITEVIVMDLALPHRRVF